MSLPLSAEAQTESKDPRWAFSPGGRNAAIFSSPAIGPDHTVYVGVTYATTPETGLMLALTPNAENKWTNLTAGGFAIRSATAESGIESSPALSPDGTTLYFGCNDGKLYALNARDGSLKWTFPTGPANAIYTSPAVGADGTIYIGSSNLGFPDDSTFYAVLPDGRQLWAKSAFDWFESSPVVGTDGTVYYGNRDHTFYAVGRDGVEKWHYAMEGPIVANPAIGPDGTLYVGSDARDFVALSPDTGKPKWRVDLQVGGGPVLAADGTIYVGTIESRTTGMLAAYTPDGRPKAGFTPLSLNGRILTVPAVRADGSLIFGAEDNKVHAVDGDGKERWSTDVGDDVSSSPAVDADGTIYVGSSGGMLYSFPGSGAGLSQLSSWPMFNHDATHRSQAPSPVQGARLTNLATRGPLAPGTNMIAGVVVEGAVLKPLLFRAVGPSLAKFGVLNPLADPTLAVRVNPSTAPFLNNDWGQEDPEEIRSVGAAVGAFPLVEGSRDAALIAVAGTGLGFNALVDTADAGSGVALVEIYDADPAHSETRLINLSTRGTAGKGDDVLIGGFVVVGPGRMRVLIRGVGPGLRAYGVPGVLAHPSLRVIAQPSGIQLATNTGWTSEGGQGDLAAAAALSGAFPLDEGSADSAMILVLDPGGYTVQLSGAQGETGVGLVEVYALPY